MSTERTVRPAEGGIDMTMRPASQDVTMRPASQDMTMRPASHHRLAAIAISCL